MFHFDNKTSHYFFAELPRLTGGAGAITQCSSGSDSYFQPCIDSQTKQAISF
jgi:hypothetical protein